MPTSAPKADIPVSAAEANRGFSRLLREVQAGQSFVVTSHGRPVARLTPCQDADAAAQRAAREAFLDRVSRRPALSSEPWTREELHER